MANLPHFQIEVGAERQRFEMPEDKSEVLVGRATDCHWAIASGAVSRRHARLVRHGREVTIEDLGSSNGTFVNGERLSAPRALRDQDRVQLGAVEMVFVMPPEEPSADETIALSALPKIERAEPRPSSPAPPETEAAGVPPIADSGERGTHTAPLPPSADMPGPEPTPAVPPEAVLPAEPVPPPPAAIPPASPVEAVGRSRETDGSQPTIAELAIIAVVSFLLVFVIGALLIRFLL
jgi:predicted component of type VI protein secretion system